MSTATRVGPSSDPTVTASGTDNTPTDPRVVEFQNTYARPCIVHNLCGGGFAIRVKINSSNTDFTTDLAHFSVNDGFAVDVSLGGLLNIQTVSFITIDAGDDLDNVQVVGWTV